MVSSRSPLEVPTLRSLCPLSVPEQPTQITHLPQSRLTPSKCRVTLEPSSPVRPFLGPQATLPVPTAP